MQPTYRERIKCSCGAKLFDIFVEKDKTVNTVCHKCGALIMQNKPSNQMKEETPPVPGPQQLHV